MRRRLAGKATLVIAALASVVSAQPAGDPAQQAFVRDYMAAISARNVDALKRHIHPASVACMTEANRDFYDFVFARALEHRPRASFQLTDVSPTNVTDPPFWPKNFARYPVRPTHQMQIDFETAPGRSTALLRHIAFSNGAWFEVMPCPTPEGVQAVRRRQGEQRSTR